MWRNGDHVYDDNPSGARRFNGWFEVAGPSWADFELF